MPKLSLIVFNLFIALSLTSNIDICKDNNGNIELSRGFLWKDQLYISTKEGHQNYRIIGFKYENNEFSSDEIQEIDPKEWSDAKLVFTVDYPNEGLRYVVIKWFEDQMKAQLHDLSDDSGKSNKGLDINPYTCTVENEPLRICQIFDKFPDEQKDKDNMLSITFFPPAIEGLPPRIFAYYKETPPKNMECFGDCYNTKRFLLIGQNISYGNESLVNEFTWLNDNSSNAKCVDLNDRIINVSIALTNYQKNGDTYYFFLLELFDTELNVYRVSINKQMVLEQFELILNQTTGTMFGCKQPTTTHNPNVTHETDSSQQTSSTDQTGADGQTVTVPSVKPKDKSSGGTFWIISAVLLIIALIVGTLLAIYFLYYRRLPQPQPSGAPNQPPSQSNSSEELQEVSQRSNSGSDGSSEEVTHL